MRLLFFILLLLPLPAVARDIAHTGAGMDFPWHAGSFFQDCERLPNSHKGEPVSQTIQDEVCLRYIEGLEMGLTGQDDIKRGCVANPLALLVIAKDIYRQNNNPSGWPVDYFREAMRIACPAE